MKKIILLLALGCISYGMFGQKVTWVSSTDELFWQTKQIRLQKECAQEDVIRIDIETAGNQATAEDTGSDKTIVFKNWGTCFNELGWKALNVLSEAEKEDILRQVFAPDGDLRFGIGRVSMNANDYALDWYSCDEVDGDFQLKYFNIDRERQSLIPFIKAAQRYRPEMTFWISPWSPPSWMKINHYYAVRSDATNEMSPLLDELLFQGKTERNQGVFPRQLTENDYMIQDPRYLEAYAHYFCKFIEAYRMENIPINMVMFQNESWSYTPYPGCAWTADGIIRFNTEYLAPILKKTFPEVALYLGTINTNRFDVIDRILSDPRMPQTIEGLGFQWEGGQIMPALKQKYPHYKYVQTESECGWGSFDWNAAEHTFERINHYLGNGCEEYTFWNMVLCDDGRSTWGWKQNALIRIDSQAQTAIFTPEYYAVKHYSHYISPGSKILAYRGLSQADGQTQDAPIYLAVMTPDHQYVLLAGNFGDAPTAVSFQLYDRYLNITLDAHSLNTFVWK